MNENTNIEKNKKQGKQNTQNSKEFEQTEIDIEELRKKKLAELFSKMEKGGLETREAKTLDSYICYLSKKPFNRLNQEERRVKYCRGKYIAEMINQNHERVAEEMKKITNID